MKPFHLLLLILIAVSCAKPHYNIIPSGYVAQTNIPAYPFQVLHAEQAYNSDTEQPLVRQQYLPVDGQFKIKADGYLLLIHLSGKMLEFNQDTTIDVAILASNIATSLSIESAKVTHRIDTEILFRDTLTYNFDAEEVIRENEYLIDIYTPAEQLNEISFRDKKYCFRWSPKYDQNPDSYRLIISDIFDDQVDSLVTDQTEYQIDLSDYQTEGGYIFLRVCDHNDEEVQSREVVLEPGKELYYHPCRCKPTSAVEALEIAYYLESRYQVLQAQHYYREAARLSEKAIFDKFLDHYLKRTERL